MGTEVRTTFNACEYLLDRRLENGDGDRVALCAQGAELTYRQLFDRVIRTATVLRGLGLDPEQRILMYMADEPAFVATYLGAMRIGAIPVPVSTMLRAEGLAELLRDSRARMLAVSSAFAAEAVRAVPFARDLRAVLVCGGALDDPGVRLFDLDAAVDEAVPDPTVDSTTPDSPAFWLYTSGTTGRPKAAMHRHGAVEVVCETYGAGVLHISREDRCLSVAKAFFAYGLGNSILFPLSVGGSTVLEPLRPQPETIARRATELDATLFFAGPTFFANMLHAGLPQDAISGVRLAVSAGEPLLAPLHLRWTNHFGVDILDGLGMTEMLHIFLSNRPGDIRPGTTGRAVAGYELRLLDDAGAPVAAGAPGTLHVRGASAATGYWARYGASREVFRGEWLRTGDAYSQDEDGYYHCLGRKSDLLKVSGMWMSPAELEECLVTHPAVAQAVVVAGTDADGLEKPVAFVLLEVDVGSTEDELIAYARSMLSSFKRPRRVAFVDAYPTTPTGKVRRVELRERADALLTSVSTPDRD
jgi:benzoate-CoA ligase family protein